MPWNDNKGGGGGGWNPGGGGRGPWGQGPQNGGRGQGPNIRPPDLDEVLKRGREWLKKNFPQQSPGGVVFAIGGGVLLALWIFTGVYVVQPAEQGIVLRFGAYVDKLGPGLHFRLPYPFETVLRPNVEQENQINIGFRTDTDSNREQTVDADVAVESLMLTGDENVVDVDFVVFWKVAEAERFLFEVNRVDETIKAVAESAMREAVGKGKIDTIQTEGRAQVQEDVRKVMQATLDFYKAGVTITRVALRKVDPPSQVIDAFRDVQAARNDQDKKRNEAQRYANTIVPQAKGEADKIILDAEAYKQRGVAEAQGEAQRFISILDQYRNARGVTRERLYLETMQKVLGGTNKVIIENKGGVVQYMPLPELRRTQPPAATGGN